MLGITGWMDTCAAYSRCPLGVTAQIEQSRDESPYVFQSRSSLLACLLAASSHADGGDTTKQRNTLHAAARQTQGDGPAKLIMVVPAKTVARSMP